MGSRPVLLGAMESQPVRFAVVFSRQEVAGPPSAQQIDVGDVIVTREAPVEALDQSHGLLEVAALVGGMGQRQHRPVVVQAEGRIDRLQLGQDIQCLVGLVLPEQAIEILGTLLQDQRRIALLHIELMQALGGMGGVSFMAQLIGTGLGVTIALIGGFAVYGGLKKAVGIRLDAEEEFNGADLSIHNISASPERETSW
jgi:hypothetical protein